MSKSKADRSKLKPATRMAMAAKEYTEHGMVNPAIYHASTITFPDLHSIHEPQQPYIYGRRGTPTSRAIESAICELEGGFNCKVAPSGQAAISLALMAFLKPGDHLLMIDAVYGPVRLLCNTVLKDFGIETEYYPPEIGANIAKRMRPNTKVVYMESPCSGTFEVMDVPAIAKIAHDHGALAIIDNTWSGGYFFKAFEHGCDVSVQAATKYIAGHSDCMFGSVVCNEKTWTQFKESYEAMGMFAGPDDMYMALRGLRTLDVRMQRHMDSAIKVASWLRGREEVEAVLYPALSNAPGHEIWKRDFTGASGLFSIILKPEYEKSLGNMLDHMEIFSMGYSYGGFESLIIPLNNVLTLRAARVAKPLAVNGPGLRLNIGLEHPDDLIADLDKGFARLKQTT
ncbi:MAG: cystathionine beta-lyase [Aestuariivirga sp.]